MIADNGVVAYIFDWDEAVKDKSCLNCPFCNEADRKGTKDYEIYCTYYDEFVPDFRDKPKFCKVESIMTIVKEKGDTIVEKESEYLAKEKAFKSGKTSKFPALDRFPRQTILESK